MEQFDNNLNLQKFRKRKTPYDALKKLKKNTSDDIKTLRAKDISVSMSVFLDIMKYPFVYFVCIYGGRKIGYLLNQGVTEEQFLISMGNVYFLFGNLLFLLVYDLLLRRTGRSLRTEFSLFRDYRLLSHKGCKSLKAKFNSFAKRGKKIFRKGVTAKSVGAQYFLHLLAGITSGFLFLGLFLLVSDRDTFIFCFDDAGFIQKGQYELLGLMTFIFAIPFIEELIYHAHNMTMLRKDVTVFTASGMVTVLYILFHSGKTLTLLFIPVIFLMSLVFDRTQNTRNIADYVAGKYSKSLFTGTEGKDKIISIKDRVGKGRKRRFTEKSANKTLSLEKPKDMMIDGNIDMETHMAEAVNDLGSIQDINKEYNITDFSSERLEGAKPDITYSFLMNVGFHLVLGIGWLLINYHEAEVGRICSRQVLIFQVILSVLILYKFIKKQHLCGMESTE
ncbi:hypothetical protein UYO_2337 [Lachnospiraceae bacterium JC7]|nr:hypothetical protein UYO_2337 [Lachnospiraceae bacterium JC7]